MDSEQLMARESFGQRTKFGKMSSSTQISSCLISPFPTSSTCGSAKRVDGTPKRLMQFSSMGEIEFGTKKNCAAARKSNPSEASPCSEDASPDDLGGDEFGITESQSMMVLSTNPIFEIEEKEENELSQRKKIRTPLPRPQKKELSRTPQPSSLRSDEWIKDLCSAEDLFGEKKATRKSTGVSKYKPKKKKPKASVTSSGIKSLMSKIQELNLELSEKTESEKVETLKGVRAPEVFEPASPELQAELDKMITSTSSGSHFFTLGQDQSNRAFKEHIVGTLQSMNFIQNMDSPDKVPPELIEQKKMPFPMLPGTKLTVVWDLDETLIHCCEDISERSEVVPVKLQTGEIVKAGINVRPFIRDCIEELMINNCENILFTASQRCYADPMIDHLEKDGQLFDYRLYRDSCIKTPQGLYVKDLRVLGRPLEKTILIDNAAYSFGFQISNGLPIIPFYDDKEDRVLKKVQEYLLTLIELPDITPSINEKFKLNQMAEANVANFINYYLEADDEEDGEEEFESSFALNEKNSLSNSDIFGMEKLEHRNSVLKNLEIISLGIHRTKSIRSEHTFSGDPVDSTASSSFGTPPNM